MRLGALILVVGGLVLAGCSNASLPVLPSPDAGAPFTWEQGMPPSCDEQQPESQPGVHVGRLLMDPADRWPGPWTSATEFGGLCMWAEVGTVDYTAKTVQLLMRDTKKGSQKAFTGHLGEVVTVGRFTVKIDPPDGRTAAVFEVDIYWAG